MVEKMPMPVMNERMQPRVKFRFPSARRSTTGLAKVRLRNDEQGACDDGDHRAITDGRVVEPIEPRALLEHVLETAEEGRHRGEVYPVDATEHRQVGTSTRIRSADSMVTAIPGATLMKKIHLQSILSVMKPPTVGPSVGATEHGDHTQDRGNERALACP